MARLMAAADGNFSTSATWVTVDAATALVTEGGVSRTALTTTSQNSANITPTSNITIDAIAIKVADVSGAVGTLTLTLYNVTTTASVVSLNIPIADLPQGATNTSGVRAGWLLFATGDQNLTSGSNYQVRMNVSSGSSTVGALTNGTTANWQHMFRTKTAAAPGAGDDLFVLGLWTASGTWTQYTVTMDSTSSATIYGSNPTGGTVEERHGLCIGKSTLTWANAGSTNYALKIAGNINVYSGGTYSQGTAGSPCDRTSTMVLTFATTTLFGLRCHVGGTVNVYGQSRTAGIERNWTYLTADMTSGSSTTASVAHETGWLNADGIYISATRTTYADAAPYTLSGAASTSSMVLSAAVSANYDGDGPFPGLVALTTYSVEITSDNSARAGDHACYSTGSWNGQWFKITHGGLDYSTLVTGNQTLRYVHFNNLNTLATARLNIGNVSHTGTWSLRDFTFVSNNNVNVCAISVGTAGTHSGMTFEDFILIQDGTNAAAIVITANGYASCRGFKASIAGAISVSAGATTAALPTNFLADSWLMSSASPCLSLPVIGNWTMSNSKFVGANNCINQPNAMFNVTFEACSFWSATQVFVGGTATRLYQVVFSNCVLGGLTAFSQTPSDILSVPAAADGGFDVAFLDCDFDDGATTPATNLLDLAGFGDTLAPGDLTVNLVNCNGAFTALARISSGTPTLTTRSFVYAHRYDQTTGDHRLVRVAAGLGRVETDATVFNTAAPSEKLTPLTAAIKLASTPKRFAVASGDTATVAVYVRKDASYNGNAARLMIKRNGAAGITADTVGDTHTAAADAWEQLTYTTPAVTDDCVIEAYVDCDGTAGVIYVDDWTAS